jgi:hypothetical protein
MNTTLLEQFLLEECTPYVRGLLEEALDALTFVSKRFDFNRFEVTVNREKGSVLLEDVLNAEDAGSMRVPLTEFAAALAAKAKIDEKNVEAQVKAIEKGARAVAYTRAMRWMLAMVVLASGCGKQDKLGESKVKLAKFQVSQLATEYYRQWAMAHVDKACPDNLDELTKFNGAPAMKDPWEHPFVTVCGPTAPPAAKGFGVVSLGRDGKQDTPDDVRSWDP